MLRQMNGRKEAKRKKNGGWTREGFFWIPLPPVFIHFLITFVSFFLSFAFCPIGFPIPGFPKKIEIPRQGEGRVGLTVGFTFSWKAILLSKEMASVDLELSSFSLLKGIDFLCKCYSSFCVLADLKTHFKITERTWVLMRETISGSRLRKMPILYLLKILPNEISNWTTRSVWFIT